MATAFIRNRRRTRSARQATAAVECALVLPMIFLLAFSTLEICSAFYLRQAAATIAFEGARFGVRGQTTRQEIIDECTALLEQRGIVQGQVAVSPSDFDKIKALDPVIVTVRAPCRGNTWFLWNLFENKDIEVSVTMAREFGT